MAHFFGGNALQKNMVSFTVDNLHKTIEHCGPGDLCNLVKLINEISNEEFSLILSKILNAELGSCEPSKLVLKLKKINKVILEMNDQTQKCIQFWKQILDWVHQNSLTIHHNLIDTVIAFLQDEVTESPEIAITAALQRILLIIPQSSPIPLKVVDLIPPLLNQITATSEEEHSTQLRNNYISTLYSVKWNPSFTITLASITRELNLHGEQLKQAVSKIVSEMEVVPIEETPPLVYQILLLSRKEQKEYILDKLISFFNFLNATYETKECSEDEIHYYRIIGTVILHISFAVKQDQELGMEVLKFVKSGKSPLSSFSISLLLALVKIQRYETQIFDILKNIITSHFKDNEVFSNCFWLKGLHHPKEIKSLFLSIIKRTTTGWEHVTEAMMLLGLRLLEEKGRIGEKNSESVKFCNSLGLEMLKLLFEVQESIRRELVDRIFNSVEVNSTNSLLFLELFTEIVIDFPHDILGQVERVKDSLDYLCYLPIPLSEKLIQAILPLIHVNSSLKDRIFLVLRKGLFLRELEQRKNSLRGFFYLLENVIKRKGDCTAENVDANTISVVSEIMGNLRRCLTQQYEIKEELYVSIQKLIQQYPFFSPYAFRIISPHVKEILSFDNDIPIPDIIKRCIHSDIHSEVRTEEPLHLLLGCFLQLFEQSKPTLETNKDILRIHERISAIIHFFETAKLEDFELSKDASTHVEKEEERNSQIGNLVIRMYESFMEYVFMSFEKTEETASRVLILFERFHTISRDLDKHVSKGKKRPFAILDKSVFSTQCMLRLLDAVNNMENTTEYQKVLQTCPAFRRHILSSFHSRIVHVSHQDAQHNKDLIIHLVFNGFALLNIEELVQQIIFATQPKVDKSKSLSILYLQVFSEILSMAIKLGMLQEQQMQISSEKNIVRSLQGIVERCISYQSPKYKEAYHVIEILVNIQSVLSKTDETKESNLTWINNLCKEKNIEDVVLVKSLLEYWFDSFFELSHFEKTEILTMDIHLELGSVTSLSEEDTEPLPEKEYVVVNPKTLEGVLSKVLFNFNEQLKVVEWGIGRLKSHSVHQDDVLDFESRMVAILSILLKSYTFLAKSCVPDSAVDLLIQSFCKLYKALGLLAKYKMSEALYITSEFIAMTALSGICTKHLYQIITWIQQSHSENRGDFEQITRKKNKKTEEHKIKQKLSKETKLLPNLIFVIEQYERQLILLSKKSKVNLLKSHKRSTVRDFRIQVQQVQRNLEALLSEEEGDEDGCDVAGLKEVVANDVIIGENEGQDIGIESDTMEGNNKRRRVSSGAEE